MNNELYALEMFDPNKNEWLWMEVPGVTIDNQRTIVRWSYHAEKDAHEMLSKIKSMFGYEAESRWRVRKKIKREGNWIDV